MLEEGHCSLEICRIESKIGAAGYKKKCLATRKATRLSIATANDYSIKNLQLLETSERKNTNYLIVKKMLQCAATSNNAHQQEQRPTKGPSSRKCVSFEPSGRGGTRSVGGHSSRTHNVKGDLSGSATVSSR